MSREQIYKTYCKKHNILFKEEYLEYTLKQLLQLTKDIQEENNNYIIKKAKHLLTHK